MSRGDENAVHEFMELTDSAAIGIWSEWMAARKKPPSKRGLQKWDVVSKGLLLRVWNSYAKFGFVRNENDLNNIQIQVLINVAKLYVNTVLMGHTSIDIGDELEKWVGIEADSEEVEELLDGFEDFAIEESSGQWRISDLVDKLVNYAIDVMSAETAEAKLVAIDMLLNFTHQRTDAAASFVQGGTATLDELSARPSEKNPRAQETEKVIMFGFLGDGSGAVVASASFDRDGNRVSDGSGTNVNLLDYDDVVADVEGGPDCPV